MCVCVSVIERPPNLDIVCILELGNLYPVTSSSSIHGDRRTRVVHVAASLSGIQEITRYLLESTREGLMAGDSGSIKTGLSVLLNHEPTDV